MDIVEITFVALILMSKISISKPTLLQDSTKSVSMLKVDKSENAIATNGIVYNVYSKPSKPQQGVYVHMTS
jgi:hypothetical protein